MRKRKDGYTFLDLAKDVLELENRPLTITQIWNIGEQNGLTDKIGSSGKTPVNTLQARLYIDIRDNCIFRPQNSICTDFQTQSHGE